MEFQYRKQNRLQNYDYSQYGAYFITICTKNREPFLSTITVPQNKTAGPQDKTNTAPHNTKNGRANPAPTVGNIMGWFKYTTTKQMAHCWNTSDNRLWQRSYHDHIIRNEQDYRNICQYINENPIRWLQKHSHH